MPSAGGRETLLVLKYTLGLLAAMVIVAASAFLLLAWRNSRDAEAGPGPVVTITVDDAGVSPPTLDVPAGRLVQLTLDNQSGRRQAVSSDDANVEQLLDNNGSALDPHNGSSLKAIRLTAQERSTNSAQVRFQEKADYTLTVQVPGGSPAVQTVRVHAK